MSAFVSPPRPVKFCGGSIQPSRILAISSTKDQVVQATGVTTRFVGVSIDATKYSPQSPEDTGYVGTATGFNGGPDVCPYYGQGDICYVMAGAAITNLQTPLTSDGSGRAITGTFPATAGSPSFYIGMPLATATAAGELIPMQIDITYSNIGAS